MSVNCPGCRADVPAGVFCGQCGGYLNPQPGDGPKWLRAGAFCAAPEEHVLRPALASSLFPHLSQLSRTPFTLGVLGMVLVAWLIPPDPRPAPVQQASGESKPDALVIHLLITWLMSLLFLLGWRRPENQPPC